MRIFELQMLHWDQIMGSSFWKLIAMTPYYKKQYKLKLDPRKLADRGIFFILVRAGAKQSSRLSSSPVSIGHWLETTNRSSNDDGECF